jgi:ArsR family transcriptional regulator, arsenate/arsenite/antimonite-responsive transcriptional repressor
LTIQVLLKYNSNMKKNLSMTNQLSETVAVQALAALANNHRLRIFRALVVAGSSGLTPSALSAQLGIAASALSFHLKELDHSKMVSVEQQGRNLIYRANFDHMSALLAYLTKHCCQGQACAVPDVSSCTTC